MKQLDLFDAQLLESNNTNGKQNTCNTPLLIPTRYRPPTDDPWIYSFVAPSQGEFERLHPTRRADEIAIEAERFFLEAGNSNDGPYDHGGR